MQTPMIGIFNLFCVGLMVTTYLRNKPWSMFRVGAVILGVLNLVGAYVNLLA